MKGAKSQFCLTLKRHGERTCPFRVGVPPPVYGLYLIDTF